MRSILFLPALFSCFALLSCQQGKNVDLVPPAELSAHLEGLLITRHDPLLLEVDFVLKNNGDVPIFITERWNSWGAKHWEFELTDAEGKIVKYENPQTIWTRNFFSTASVEPDKEHRTRCLLTLSQPKKHRTGIREFRAIEEPVSLIFPATLVGTFLVPEIQSDGEQVTNWKGSVTTPKITLVQPEG